MKNQKLLSLGAGVAAVASIAAGTVFGIGGSDSSSALGLSDSQLTQIAANVAATPAEERDAYLAKLAANLGVDVDKLKEAITKTNGEVIDAKVADGSMTQAQADAMRERMANGGTWFFAGGKGPGGHGDKGFGMKANADLAAFLGIDAATLHSEQEAGKTLATIASEHGKSRDELKSFLTEAQKTALAQAVTDGRLTQAQADEKLAQFTANLDTMIDKVHTHDAKGPRGGMPMTPPSTSGTN